jgi:hypothetical protein
VVLPRCALSAHLLCFIFRLDHAAVSGTSCGYESLVEHIATRTLFFKPTVTSAVAVERSESSPDSCSMLATLAAALAVSTATRTVVGAQHGLCGTDNASQKCTTHQPMGAERLQAESRHQTADDRQAQAAHTYCRVKTTSQARPWPWLVVLSMFERHSYSTES